MEETLPLPCRTSDEAIADGAACLAAAIEFIKLGIAALPLCDPDHLYIKKHRKNCDSRGKAPLVCWTEYQETLPSIEDVHQWWRQWPTANVGATMGGVSRLVRVDIEGAGEAILQKMSGGDLPKTWEFTSGRKDGTGRGLLYRLPTGDFHTVSEKQYGAPGELRLQGTGAQTVLPPSRHPSGSFYTWKAGCSPTDMAPAPAPVWLFNTMQGAATSRNGTNGHYKSNEDWQRIFGGVPEGSRNDNATTMIGKILASIADLDNESQMQTAWWCATAVNDRNSPPLEEEVLRDIFVRLKGKEVEQRRNRTLTELGQFVGRQIDAVEKTCIPPDAKEEELPQWHLIILASDPPTYRLRAPFWSDSTILDKGYILLDGKQILNWSPRGNSIRNAAFEQAGRIIPATLKDWANPGGFLEKLLGYASREEVIVDKRRDLVVAGWFYRYLQFPAELKETKDDPEKFIWPNRQGTLSRRPSGDLYFKREHLTKKIHVEHEDFTRAEITQVLTRFAEAVKIENNRWWVVKAANVEVIGRLCGEIE